MVVRAGGLACWLMGVGWVGGWMGGCMGLGR